VGAHGELQRQRGDGGLGRERRAQRPVAVHDGERELGGLAAWIEHDLQRRDLALGRGRAALQLQRRRGVDADPGRLAVHEPPAGRELAELPGPHEHLEGGALLAARQPQLAHRHLIEAQHHAASQQARAGAHLSAREPAGIGLDLGELEHGAGLGRHHEQKQSVHARYFSRPVTARGDRG
jgi:hypothetical protein